MRFIRVVSTGAVGFALACGGAETAEDPQGAVAADPDHYSVEFENDAIRVIRVVYGPGESSVMHSHPRLCSVALSSSSWEMTNADGTVEENTGMMGDVECGTEGSVHNPRNASDGTNEAILVEIKPGAMAASGWMPEQPHAVAADPDHYSVVAENEIVRMVRVRYGAGETSVMHHHPAHCVVYLQSGPVTFGLPSGETVEAPDEGVGSVICNDGAVHLPTNTSDGDIEVVLVELKGRAAFGG